VFPECWQKRLGFGTTVAWPTTSGASDAIGNSGMVEKIAATLLGRLCRRQLSRSDRQGGLRNRGASELRRRVPAAALWPRTPPDERLTLVNAPGANAYPLINYEYAVVSKKQPNPETAAALRSFLLWAIAPDETNAQHLADAHFIPLPAHVWVLSHDQIEEIR
jgi:phosphate transport system substrate-binding protein